MAPALDLNDHVSFGRLAIEKMIDSLEMILDVRPQCWRYLDMTSCILKFHKIPPFTCSKSQIPSIRAVQSRSYHRFSFPRPGYLHLVAIFGDCSARKFDAFLTQDLCDLVVGHRLLGILFLDHLLDL